MFDSRLKMNYPHATMSFSEVVEELPSFTAQERRELALRLFDLGTSQAESEDMAGCEHSASLGFSMLDAMEAEEVRR